MTNSFIHNSKPLSLLTLQDLLVLSCQLLSQPHLCREFWMTVSLFSYGHKKTLHRQRIILLPQIFNTLNGLQFIDILYICVVYLFSSLISIIICVIFTSYKSSSLLGPDPGFGERGKEYINSKQAVAYPAFLVCGGANVVTETTDKQTNIA